MYSTPTQFYADLRADNEFIAENGGWPVRRDDLFPMEDPESKSYLSGYYSARPLLKQASRRLATTFHSASRLLAQQMLRTDLDEQTGVTARNQTLAAQQGVMELISSLQSLDGVSGSQKERLAQDYMLQASEGLNTVNELNTQLISERLAQLYGIHTSQLTPVGDVVRVVDGELRSDWATSNEIMMVIQSPSNHYREELVEVQVPFYNFTLNEVRNDSVLTPVSFEKYLPRLWQNDNTTLVPSLAQFRVSFNPKELFKVFVIKNEGVIRETNPAPEGRNASLIWNLNLPVFRPRYEGDIDNFQPNFRQLWPGNSIHAGTKTLTFVEIQQGAYNDTVAAKTGRSSPSIPANGTAENSTDSLMLA